MADGQTRSTVVSVRLDDLSVQAVDLLVQAGLAQSRSEAVAQFVAMGVRAAEELLQQARELADRVQRARQDMIEAVKAKDVSRVQALLDTDATLVNAAEGGDTAVLMAMYYGAREVADLLLSRGAQLNIFEAAAVGEASRIRQIIASEPDLVRAYSHDGWTALHLAGFFGQVEAVELLLKAGSDIVAVGTNRMANTPLHAALAARRTEAARLLIAHGADVNRPDGAGWTPLHLAAGNGSLEMVDLLLQKGARPGARTEKGQTPLELAVERSHTAVAELLQRERA